MARGRSLVEVLVCSIWSTDQVQRVAVGAGRRVEGERLEGRGVMPAVLVPFRLPYAAGHDPQLDAALAELAHAS
jgi:C-terminal processing protease CtpA/Prc